MTTIYYLPLFLYRYSVYMCRVVDNVICNVICNVINNVVVNVINVVNVDNNI